MLLEADEELKAVHARFRALVMEWDLGRADAAALLGVPPDALGLDLVPITCGADAEHRLRLLTEIRSLLPVLLPAPGEVAVWLRVEDTSDSDFERTGTPLTFMCAGVANLRALRAALHRHV